MLTILKRLLYAVSVPAVLALSGWMLWTMFGGAAAVAPAPEGASRSDVVRGGDQPAGRDRVRTFARAADPAVAPAAGSDRPSRDGATGPVQPPIPEASALPAQAVEAAPEIRITFAPAAARTAAARTADEKLLGGPGEAEPARSPGSATKETSEHQALPPRASQEERPVARRQKAEQARQGRSARSARPAAPDGIGRREVQALIAELRRSGSIEDMAARFDALGRPPW